MTPMEAAQATNGRWGPGTPAVEFTRFAIDSRAVTGGELFFAIAGPHHDGHDFLPDAIGRGAAAAVVSRAGSAAPAGTPLLQVPDTLAALQTLSMHVRRRRPLRVAGITGSSGKTTAKELTAAAVGARFVTHRTPGNLNNAFGLPMALLATPDDAEAAVLEMGMSTPGEIARLAEIADPDVGAILNVGEAHREHFDSVDAIADAKAELWAGMRSDATAVYNAGDPRVAERAARFPGPRLSFGVDCDADVAASGVQDDIVEGVRFHVRTRRAREGAGIEIRLRLYGRHNAANATAACAIALAMGIEPLEAAAALAAVPPVAGRGVVERLGSGVVLVDETYNSNPTAMRAVLSSLRGTRWAGRRLVVAGDMLELGGAASALHRLTGRLVAESGTAMLLAVGPLAAETAAGAKDAGLSDIHVFADSAAAARALPGLLRANDLVVVKGSRGIGTEAAAAAVRAAFPAGTDGGRA